MIRAAQIRPLLGADIAEALGMFIGAYMSRRPRIHRKVDNPGKEERMSASVRRLAMVVVVFAASATNATPATAQSVEDTVTLQQTVNPNITGVSFAVQLGTTMWAWTDLHRQIRPSGNKVLRITSMQGYIYPPFPTVAPRTTAYAHLRLAQCETGSTFGTEPFAAPRLSISGRGHSQIDFRPGLPIVLSSDTAMLCLIGHGSGNSAGAVSIHGFLEDRP